MNLPPVRGRSNTILVVDDKREIHGFYWQIFNPNEQEFDPPFLPPRQDLARVRALQIEYSGCFDEFERGKMGEADNIANQRDALQAQYAAARMTASLLKAKEAAANVGAAFRKAGEALGQAIKNASTNQE